MSRRRPSSEDGAVIEVKPFKKRLKNAKIFSELQVYLSSAALLILTDTVFAWCISLRLWFIVVTAFDIQLVHMAANVTW